MEGRQKTLKSSSILYYMFKPSHLLTQGFDNNSTTQEKIFKHMCNFGARAEYREGISVISYYLDVETTKYQCCLLNTKTLDCITGYIMEDSIGNRVMKRLTQRRLNFIDGSISSYCCIPNSPKLLEYIEHTNKMTPVLCDL